MLKNPLEDLIYQSQAGTGKTVAFAIAILSRCDPTKKFPQAVCISHTSHLVIHTGEVLRALAQFTDLKIAVHHKNNKGSMQKGEKIQEQILIITPGKMVSYCNEEKKKHGGHFSSGRIKTLVIDDVDNLLDSATEKERGIADPFT